MEHAIQTESSTEVLKNDSDVTCYEKAKLKQEPTFTLRAQDISADLVLDFWIAVQIEMRQGMEDGLTMEQALTRVRDLYVVAPWSQFSRLSVPKLAGAVRIGQAMSQWPNRKVAD